MLKDLKGGYDVVLARNIIPVEIDPVSGDPHGLGAFKLGIDHVRYRHVEPCAQELGSFSEIARPDRKDPSTRLTKHRQYGADPLAAAGDIDRVVTQDVILVIVTDERFGLVVLASLFVWHLAPRSADRSRGF